MLAWHQALAVHKEIREAVNDIRETVCSKDINNPTNPESARGTVITDPTVACRLILFNMYDLDVKNSTVRGKRTPLSAAPHMAPENA